jgi:hypothetical protein
MSNYSDHYDVFLSYRRDGGETMAILLRDRLAAKGYRVFLDIESLNSGSFNKALFSVIERCTDVVLVCSKDCLERCKNDGDWVRLEIVYALERRKNIVPIMLRGFEWPDVLPDDIEELRMQNGVNANSHEYFDAAIDRLTDKFLKSKPYTPQQQPPQQPAKKPLFKLTKGMITGIACLALVAGIAVGSIVHFTIGSNRYTPASADPDIGTGATPQVLPEPSDETLVVNFDGITRFGRHDWRALEMRDGMVLMITNTAIENNKMYHEANMDITWEHSDIRQYLNNEFYNGFTPNEKARIADTLVQNNDNPWYGTWGGNDTIDKVFLLSIEEVVRYFGDSGQLWSRPWEHDWIINDEFNWSRITGHIFNPGGASYWWLRSPGYNSQFAAFVDFEGQIWVSGNVTESYESIRPALWVIPDSVPRG